MMKKLLLTVSVIWLLVLFGCQQAEINMSSTATSYPTSTPPLDTATDVIKPTITKTAVPTLFYFWSYTATPNPDATAKPTVTAPPSRFSQGELPNNLWIEEYNTDTINNNSNIILRYPERGGVYYYPKGGLIDGKLFQAKERVVSGLYGEIYATLDGEEFANIECGQVSPIETVITAWTYENHWIRHYR